MEITIGLWIVPLLVSIGILLWINYGFDYSGDYNFTPVFTIPLWGFMTATTWMIYFAFMYFWSKP